MRQRRWLLLTLYGLLVAIAVSDALKATRPKFKIATTSTTTTTTEEPAAAESADDEVEATTIGSNDTTNGTTGHTLTGIPQIDYIWDPNLPRELNGYNLSEYPFYASMPEDIDFKCDGLHDGFYASVPHKCQVYHHCLFGTRYDFLCANFTAFDQKTFICHFASEVDCANSKKYWHRNDALYKAATTTTTSTTTTSTTSTTTTPHPPAAEKAERIPVRDRDSPSPIPRRRRPPPPRRPIYEYYEEEYYDDDYERERPRGSNRRDYDDYDDRMYRRDRDRNRDYRHRDFRDRFPMRRDPPARVRDPVEDEPLVRPRLRDQDPSRTRDVEDRLRDGDDRRYSDKRFRDDYDEKDVAPVPPSSSESPAKPVGPPASLYARSRSPPKQQQRRPLSEPDKYVYSVSTTGRSLADERRRPVLVDEPEEPRRRPMIDDLEDQQPRLRRPMIGLDSAEDPLPLPRPRRPVVDTSEEILQPRRRPVVVDVLDDEDYYEDEVEEIRPRWQMRGRPMREREFDKRYRGERPYRSRYRDEEEEIRPRKQHPERSRDRLYERERGRDRSLDRPKDKPDRSIYDRPRDNSPPKKPNLYERSTTEKPTTTSTTTTTTTTTTEEPRTVKYYQKEQTTTEKDNKYWKPTLPPQDKEEPLEDYPAEYYDDVEEPAIVPIPPPRPTPARVTKRPFLPSRGGNPNPRGLSPVGSKALPFPRRDETPVKSYLKPAVQTTTEDSSKAYQEEYKPRPYENKQSYNYNAKQQTEQQKTPQVDSYDRRRPEPEPKSSQKPSWSPTEYSEQRQSQNDNSNLYSLSYKTTSPEEVHDQNNNSYKAKQKLNEVTHHNLQDIPESEYDVALNEALTPNLSQEPSLPSGFVLPLHRQFNRDALLQPSENNYKFSRPVNQQQQQQQQQKPQFAPQVSPRNSEYRSAPPETVQISGTQYRQQRAHWADYTGY